MAWTQPLQHELQAKNFMRQQELREADPNLEKYGSFLKNVPRDMKKKGTSMAFLPIILVAGAVGVYFWMNRRG